MCDMYMYLTLNLLPTNQSEEASMLVALMYAW